MKFVLISVIVICYVSHGSSIEINNSSRLDDLNIDVLLKMLNNYELEQLVNFVDVNPQFRELITQHYIIPEYRLHEKTVWIQRYDYKQFFMTTANITIVPKAITIYGLDLGLKILRNFGHVFTRVSGAINDPRLWSYIDQYCRESLVELTMNFDRKDFLLEWRKPFKNVRSIEFCDLVWNFENNNMNLSDMFPSLRHLDLARATCSSSKCIDYNFPNLEHIAFPMYTNSNESTKNRMHDNIFDLNPQLRSIHVWEMNNFDVLHAANEKLHNLEAIKISYLTPDAFRIFDGETIHFKTVKRLFVRLKGFAKYTPNIIPLKFDQLEEMEIDCVEQRITDKWIEFIGQQHKLKNLNTEVIKLNLQQWMSIFENLPQLEEIETAYGPIIGYEGVAEVMASKRNLKKIKFYGQPQNIDAISRSRIHPQWQIGHITRYGITFIRKEN